MVTTFDQKIAEYLNGWTVNDWPIGNLVLCAIALFLTVVLCGAIGIERERKGRSAGLRTHLLVGVGSCIIMIISIYGFPSATEGKRDVARLVAQVVTGIGFLGAGVIMHRNGGGVRGLTTAASIWVVMTIGIACGSFNFILAFAGTILILIVLTVFKKVEEYPIGALQASFKWITESTVSPRQKLDKLGKIQFSYHTGEIRIAQSFLSQLLTIEAFESKITEVIAIAYVKAMDDGIINGTGNGQMLGILNDPRVLATGQVVTMTAAQINNWTAWRKQFFAKLPLGYRDGEFIFPVSTVDAYLETMADGNNNPIFRQSTGLVVNDGDAMNPNGRFFGRDISLVEPDIIADFDTASANDIIGVFWQPEEYAINENFGFTMRRYFDEETNEWVDKALVVVDGKVLNPNGIWLIKKA